MLVDIREIAKKTFLTCDHHMQGIYLTVLLLNRKFCHVVKKYSVCCLFHSIGGLYCNRLFDLPDFGYNYL